jgi:hypothetical protein
MSRLVISESVKVREDGKAVFDTETRVPTPTPLPTKYNQESRTALHPDTDTPIHIFIMSFFRPSLPFLKICAIMRKMPERRTPH